LPVGTEDPVERLQSMRAQMDWLKESGQAVAGEVLTSLSGFAPPLLLALGGRLAARSPNLGVQTGVTTVPGPQQPLQTLGRRMLESLPVVPLIGNVRISIAIFSYNGGVVYRRTANPARISYPTRWDVSPRRTVHAGAVTKGTFDQWISGLACVP
jgi:diacylglycerol O-acyltransferase / wax synthase